MAGAHVQTKDTQVGSGTSCSVNLTSVGAGNHLVAFTWCFSTGAPTLSAPTSTPSATWSSGEAQDTYNYVGTAFQAGRIDYSENTASGSWTVQGNLGSGSAGLGICASESSGAKTSASLGSHPAVVETGSQATGQATSFTPTAGSVVYTYFVNDSGNTANPSVDSSFTLRSDATMLNGSTTERAGAASKDNVAASALAPTWTESSGTAKWSVFVIEFLAAAAAGGIAAITAGMDMASQAAVGTCIG